MSLNIQAVRGTKDLYGEDAMRFRHVVYTARTIGQNYGFNFFSTPILEFAKTFSTSLGNTSDIVSKEMYSFDDRNGESLTLRPEFTAGIVRAIFSNGLQQHLPLRLFSYGPLFRYERPQKGRQRQFHQVNFECFGLLSPVIDAEIISLANQICIALGLENKYRIHINSLGSLSARASHREALVKYYQPLAAKLSEDSRVRLEKNPLRILDSKDEGDRELNKNAPKLIEFYSNDDANYFHELKNCLDYLGIQYRHDHNLVRGLDYYSHTIFEFITDELGAQGTLLGGGRYDGLTKLMGGEEIPAIGFAAGIERLMELILLPKDDTKLFTVMSASGGQDTEALLLADLLRKNNKRVLGYYGEGLGKKFKKASKEGANFALIIGEEEIRSKTVTIKDMMSGTQERLNRASIVEYVSTL